MKLDQKVLANGIMGKITWIDAPWKTQAGKDADLLVKVKLTQTGESRFFRLSELIENTEITPEEMELNEIKKALYKENPNATLEKIRSGTAYYSAHIASLDKVIRFEIPVNDMADADFRSGMDSKLLIRWIVQ
jgi:hypothetical protein